MKRIRTFTFIIMVCMAGVACVHAQEQEDLSKDSLPSRVLDTITVNGYRVPEHHLQDVEGVNLFAGKKTDVVNLQPGAANLAQNMGRMAFARMPGVNVWEMDGAGTQINIGTRGSDAHRSIEMNMRQNGYNSNSDIFGYPEDHYTPPMQAIEKVELVRGAAALQFGSQFGGMMNYLMKRGDTTRTLSFESEQTYGSDNLFNSFNALSGKSGHVNYYGCLDVRNGDGWRDNAAFDYKAGYVHVGYEWARKGNIAFEFSSMNYRQQIAGGLTDMQFDEDPRQSNRTRNFFRPIIHIPAILFNYDLSSNTHLQVITHAIWGERSSVQFIHTPDVEDTINTTTGTYSPRQVDRDFYSGAAVEVRVLHLYNIGKVRSSLAAGISYFSERTKRRQKGPGTTEADFDLSLTNKYGVDLRFHTLNYALFAENMFQLSERLSVTPGMRVEVINSNLNGVINGATVPVSYAGNRHFPLFGIGAGFKVNEFSQFYSNISQAYRPFLYAFITPATEVDKIDPDLKDSKGYSIDFGYRGHVESMLTFDINGYSLFYGDRIGKLTLDQDGSSYLLTTNIGDAIVRGIESYVDFSLSEWVTESTTALDIRLFNSTSFTHARYATAAVSAGGENVSLKGNQVEGVPEWILRSGISSRYKGLTSTLQLSYVSGYYSDANNTTFNPTGATGFVPGYSVWDWAVDWNFLQRYHISAGINNLADAKYFTRRITMYPGPGILPADGRTGYVSISITL